ncbi:carbamoyltransferase N-terminal domain-containing protein [Bacillus cereus]|uniref:carbamoyltransferase N-terminal domain-containing protein n=1 Tax=Bacillus cereus TaxID=1396 RepID=UPI0039807EAB
MKKYSYQKNGYLILGVNGWGESGHDASAVLLEVNKDSCKILGALEEEKVTKKKCSFDTFPVHSIRYLLEAFNLTKEDIDHIAFGWNYPGLYDLSGKEYPYPDEKLLLQELFPDDLIENKIPITFIDHHLAHAACTYRTSHFEESLIFVVDGQGESESSSVWLGRNNEIKLLNKIHTKESLGYLYEALNSILSFKSHESGKTMGLASYGKPKYTEDLKKCFEFKDGLFTFNKEMLKYYKTVNRFSTNDSLTDQVKLIKMWQYYIQDKLNLSRQDTTINSFYEIDDERKDLASSVQNLLENMIIQLIENFVRKTGIENICLSGGVALNCIMNGKILEKEFVDDLFINPAANDAGVALGAALELSNQLGFKSKISEGHFNPFLGIEYTNDEIIKELEISGMEYRLYDDASKHIASLIEKDKVVAVFQGRNEWGPRALGNRTILSSPKEQSRLDYINSSIKERELGRPLGPSMLDEDKDLLLDNPKSLGRYMNVAYKAEKNLEKFPAIIHVDNTFRPEFVNESFNKLYYEQLRAIKSTSGSSIVINTSFNLKTPIIFHIEDAIEYFNNSKIDALVFNNQIVLEKV